MASFALNGNATFGTAVQPLASLVQQYGTNRWPLVAQAMQNRNTRQCKEPWTNHPQPYTQDRFQDRGRSEQLAERSAEHGTKWQKISKFLIHRTPISLRNRHMALVRKQRKTMSSSGARPVVAFVEQRAIPPPRYIPTPFSDEELKTFLEDMFAETNRKNRPLSATQLTIGDSIPQPIVRG
jgi:hypothetical protein